jgi:hypothetical protein
MKKLALIAGAGLLAFGSAGAADAQVAQYGNWIERPNDADHLVCGGILPHPVPVINERAPTAQSPGREGVLAPNGSGNVVSTGSVHGSRGEQLQRRTKPD